MVELGYWRRKLASIHEWSSVERACVPIVLAAVLYLQHFFWGMVALAHDDARTMADHAFLLQQWLFSGSVITAAVLLVIAGRDLNRTQPDALWFQHLGANFYGISLVWGGYTTGTLSMPTGVVLAGAPLIGFLLLERRVTLVAIAVAFSAVLLLNLTAAHGLLPYAPALRAPTDTDSALFWVGSHLAFAAPHLIVNTALCAILLDQWRRREAEALALSVTDSLTQVNSRRRILDLLEAEVALARRHGTPLAVALLDLDHFKRINDRYGHPAGDHVLQSAARALRTALRPGDAVGRFGGEEFLLLLPATEPAEAQRVLERCRQAVETLAVSAEGGAGIPVTASFGLACCDRRLEPVGAALISAADTALYEAKVAGRNRVVVADRAVVAAAVDADTGQLAATNIRQLPVNEVWWKSRQGWKQQVTRVLDWNMLDKAALFLGLLLTMQAGVLVGVMLDLQRPDMATLFNGGIARAVVWLQLGQSAGALLLLGMARLLSEREVRAPWFEHLTLQYCALAMVSMGFGTGILGISTGVVLTVGPLVGFILFRRVAVLGAFATALAGVAGLAYASAVGWLPYAPLVLVAEPAWQIASPSWVLTNYLFFMPVLCVGLILADQILGRWREREARIRHLGLTDPLTGVHNRRSILRLLQDEVARTCRSGPPLVVVILDLDFFKKINDTYGHHTGDRVLQETTRVLRATLRQGDALGRFGGEEFLMLLPDTRLEGALALVERCREQIAGLVVRADNGEDVTFTASFGLVSNAGAPGLDSDALITAADNALYRAKDAGRNCVEVVTGRAA